MLKILIKIQIFEFIRGGFKVLVTFVRSIVLYIIILIVMRLMGKREIGQLQPFELVVAILIADLASIPMAEVRNTITKWNCANTWAFSYAPYYFNSQHEKYTYERNYMWKTYNTYL